MPAICEDLDLHVAIFCIVLRGLKNRNILYNLKQENTESVCIGKKFASEARKTRKVFTLVIYKNCRVFLSEYCGFFFYRAANLIECFAKILFNLCISFCLIVFHKKECLTFSVEKK